MATPRFVVGLGALAVMVGVAGAVRLVAGRAAPWWAMPFAALAAGGLLFALGAWLLARERQMHAPERRRLF